MHGSFGTRKDLSAMAHRVSHEGKGIRAVSAPLSCGEMLWPHFSCHMGSP